MELTQGTMGFLTEEKEKGRHFVCFGAGALLRQLCNDTGIEENIDVIVDNNSSLWEQIFELCGINHIVHAPSYLQSGLSGNQILLITTV